MHRLQDSKTILLIINLFTFCLAVNAQETITKHFIGINPSVTAEPFYEKGEIDINVLPFVYQRILTEHIDIRFISNFAMR